MERDVRQTERPVSALAGTLPVVEPTPAMRQTPEFLGDLAGHTWLPFSDKIQACVSWHEPAGSAIRSETERIKAIAEATAEVRPGDLVYYVSSQAANNLVGWEICHTILVATREALTTEGNIRSLRIDEDVHNADSKSGVFALLSWKEGYNSTHGIFVIQDSFVAIRSGFQRDNQRPDSQPEIGWGMEMYNGWLGFVERSYEPRDILKIIAASSKVESALCARFEGARRVYTELYNGGEASPGKQRMYCFTRETPPKVAWKTIREAQHALQSSVKF